MLHPLSSAHGRHRCGINRPIDLTFQALHNGRSEPNASTAVSDQPSPHAPLPECPEVLFRKNCFTDYLTPEEQQQVREWRQGAAQRLRAALGSMPFYAARAEKARLEGDEMAYWLELQASEMTLRRR